jgi:flagellar protein FlaG
MITQNISGTGQGGGVSSEMSSSQAVKHPSMAEAAKSAATLEMPVLAVKPTAETANRETVKQATEMINKAIQSLSRNLMFTVDEESKENVVKVMDMETGEVIRQIPSEETLAIAKALDKFQGMIIQQKA